MQLTVINPNVRNSIQPEVQRGAAPHYNNNTQYPIQ